MSEPAESHYAHLLPFADVPMPHWRVSCNAGTQKRSRCCQIQFVRNPEHEFLIHHDARRISTVSDATGVFILAAISQNHSLAELLQPFFAIRTRPARVHHATDRDPIPFFKFLNVATRFHHATDDLVPGHAWVSGETPLISGDMQVRVADS